MGLSARVWSAGLVRIRDCLGTCTPTPLMSTSARLLISRLSTSSSLVSTVNTMRSGSALRNGSVDWFQLGLRTRVRLLPGVYDENWYGPDEIGLKVYFAPPLALWS